MHLLQRPLIGTAYISLYSTHARGVSVLVHHSILFSCARVEVNTEGRFVCLLRTIFSQTLVLAALGSGAGENVIVSRRSSRSPGPLY